RSLKAEGPLVMGVDPAGEGGDRFAIAFRRGYVVERVIYRDKIDPTAAVQWLKEEIDANDPAMVFIDGGGMGSPVISFLPARGPRYGHDRVKAVNFGAKSQFKMGRPQAPGPKNRRAEMYSRMRDWLQLEEGVSIPDMDQLQGDLCETRVKPTLTNDLQLEAKD